MTQASSFLIIQTAFIGDVVLATAIAEKLHERYPQAPIDFLLRKGNEDLLKSHPYLRTVLVWDKKKNKIRNLLRIIRQVRSERYDYVINVHRFLSSGLITLFSGAKESVGFDKNPLSPFFKYSVKHSTTGGSHEVDRNQLLIARWADGAAARPRLYPGEGDYNRVHSYRSAGPYICIAPTSVWFTKQFPKEKWIEFMNGLPSSFRVYLLGASSDKPVCDEIVRSVSNIEVISLAGELRFLESAALMQYARMNFVNDSAPLHFASAVNAPVTAVFCSTVPGFGFGPLSDVRYIVETAEQLACRPCGLHGFKACPQGHFKCALTVSIEQLGKFLIPNP